MHVIHVAIQPSTQRVARLTSQNGGGQMGRISVDTNTGILVGDQRKDQLLFLRDLDGDGTASGSDETIVFFDQSNESGLTAPTNNVFTVHQATDKSVYVGDGTTDTVYRLMDINRDGDAQDDGEAAVWFSADNAAGLSTVTPNGIAEGDDGAIYVANAGTGSVPQDAIYRTVDLNGDGDANDAGEATVWLDVQTIIDTAVPFDLSFDGNVAYLNDLTGTATDVIYRIEDRNGDGSIQTDEVINFISDDMNFGAPVDISSAVSLDGSLYTLTWFPDGDELLKIYRLNDLDGSGQIDSVFEATEVWNASAMPDGIRAEIGFSIATDDAGGLILTANSFAGDGNVVKLTNLNGDGDFFDAGETVIFGSDQFDDQLDRPRAVTAYEGDAQPVLSTVGAGNHFSVFLKDRVLYSSGENIVSQLGNGATGFDIKAPLPVDLPQGFDATITSVAGGLLHTTFLTDDGDVYAFGFNNRGPLGLGDEDSRTSAVKIDALDDFQIIAIENGNSTSFALAADGTLYGWGNNSNGQLGTGDQDERLVPTVIEALSDESVVAISAGVTHTLVLTAKGEVYGFGSNVDNQVSPSEERRVIEPTLVEGLPNDIVAVTGEGRTSYAITADGDVYGWGENSYGQLLQGSDNADGTFDPASEDIATPIQVTGLPEGVVDIKGGARWSVALTEDGDVYAWGPNDEGPTGGLDGDPALDSDVSFYPTKIAELDDVHIVEIQTGPNSIIAVSDTGEVFTWGSNSDGRLGYASDGSVYFPQQVDFDADPAPFLKSALPADNGRDVANDAALVLTFTEAVVAGAGTITLVDRTTGEQTVIDVTDSRLVRLEGDIVTITPPEHLTADAGYAVEIDEGAFLDIAGQSFAGIAEGDTSTFNFTTSDQGAASNNSYQGTFDDDLLRGGVDDDRISGQSGIDLISGGAGNDRLNGGSEGDDLRGGAGADVLNGGTGSDLLDGGDGHDLLNGGAGGDRIEGGDGNDRLNGQSEDDTLLGGAGNDKLNGGSGDDDLSGEDGDDNLNGGVGDDILNGGLGDDRLVGGLGDDLLDGGAGGDALNGGLGSDVFVFNGGHDVIWDFDTSGQNTSGDEIMIDLAAADSFADLLSLANQTASAVTFEFSEDDSLNLNGVTLAELDADMFSFV